MTCRTCGAPIFLAVSALTGKKVPIDEKEDPSGTLVVEHGLVMSAKSIAGSNHPPDQPRHTSHFATCQKRPQ